MPWSTQNGSIKEIQVQNLGVLKLQPLLYADKFSYTSLITSNAVGWYELFDALFYITLCLLN